MTATDSQIDHDLIDAATGSSEADDRPADARRTLRDRVEASINGHPAGGDGRSIIGPMPNRDERLPSHGLDPDIDPYTNAPRSNFQRWLDKIERRVSLLSTRNNFWHRVCAWVFLPLAYRSGIRFWQGEESTFSAVLPFNRFNKNWYNAMAGGALLGNAEVAGGMYVFEHCGGDYTVVCKHLEYTFRRPCYGPAVYRIEPREAIKPLVDQGGEFNITVDMRIVQMVTRADEKEKRVGNCVATFHVTPKSLARKQFVRMQQRATERMRRIADQQG